MLAVARALMASPKLLVMDEPSIGLSPLLVAGLANIISDINQEGISSLLIEQNYRMALKLTKRAYILELGRVVLHRDTGELADDEHKKKHYFGGVGV
jgi:branched-chain amino acid transport system ATP-binding protein